MASSESENGSQAGLRTPTNTKILDHSKFTASELSPPGSQKKHTSESSNKVEAGPLPGREHEGNSTTGIDVEAESDENKPGASWLNRRAEEDYQRAMELVVDKDFSLSMLALILVCEGVVLTLTSFFLQRSLETRLMIERWKKS